MSVKIGFSEDCESWEIESRLFPDKIGGKPAWLSLENLPKLEHLNCDSCNKPMIFLCQLYKPYEEEEEENQENFHRTLFVFTCRDNACCKRNVNDTLKVFRSTLPRMNKFYSSDPPDYDKPDSSFLLSKWAQVCELCGISASKHCSNCKKTAYCCRDHQVKDWKENHKEICGKSTGLRKESRYLFKEFKIEWESEEIDNAEVDEAKELENFKKLKSEGKVGTIAEVSETDLEAHCDVTTDKAFMAFKKRIERDQEQLFRYERGGEPLWIAESPVPETIPKCEYCYGPRQFEFQIMPQILSELNECDIDWGILAVYTCKNSCDTKNSYRQEYIFKQDISE